MGDRLKYAKQILTVIPSLVDIDSVFGVKALGVDVGVVRLVGREEVLCDHVTTIDLS